jgi:acyl-CoA thioesterase FadM
MNLWLRLLAVIIGGLFRPRLTPPLDVSRLDFRVWPHDLDTSLHMNNGRYWTIMDLGRADLMLRSGLWRAVLRHGWLPVVSAGKIRFRREIRLFRPFRLETRIVTFAETWLVGEHRILTKARDGSEILAAVALVRIGLYDRKGKAYVPVARMLAEVGAIAEAPPVTPEIAAFLAAEEAMKQAG